MMTKKLLVLCFVAASVVSFSALSCSSNPKVTRVETQADLSGYWNDTDIQTVCNNLIQDALDAPRLNQAIGAFKSTPQKPRPVVVVGTFYNDSDEHIDTEIISKKMETALFNSGRLDFVAGDKLRQQIRDQKQDQQLSADPATAARLGKEVGADYILTGSVKINTDTVAGRQARTYYVFGSLYDVETNRLVWQGQKDVKKDIVRPKNKL